MTWTIPETDQSSSQFDIDLDRVIYDPEYRNEVKSALASGEERCAFSTGFEAD